MARAENVFHDIYESHASILNIHIYRQILQMRGSCVSINILRQTNLTTVIELTLKRWQLNQS